MKENKDKFIVCEYGTKAIIKVKMRQRTQMTHVTFKLKNNNNNKEFNISQHTLVGIRLVIFP